MTRLLVLPLAGLAAALVIAAVYLSDRPADNDGDAARAGASAATTERKAAAGAASEGSLAAFVVKSDRPRVPDVAFTDANGQSVSLADFKGKTILLNLWATWCAPCRKEMPDLDRLQRDLGSETFKVVALSLDRGGLDASKAFLDKIGVKHLELYVDDTGRASTPLKIIGMPTTLLIDPDGREIGRLIGPAPWDSPEAKALISTHSR
ncbi:MAG: TlpA disulfide reductase family protein [Hyphomicrobiaceae bacterium]|nr:TlpA disulfide reductase family protein [Hyphomicrobiaceae bacterium]